MLETDTIARPSFTTRCAQCGDVLIAPEWSEHVSERYIRHLWSCEACGHDFETAFYLGHGRHNPAGRNLRQRAEECLRLSRELPSIEHKFLALGMANAWILLAEMAGRLAAG
jgi:hypothetical protein